MPAVRQLAQGDAEEGVKHAERGAIEETDLVIPQAQVGLDVLGKDGDDIAVDEIENIHHDKNAQSVPAIGRDLFQPHRIVGIFDGLRVCGLIQFSTLPELFALMSRQSYR